MSGEKNLEIKRKEKTTQNKIKIELNTFAEKFMKEGMKEGRKEAKKKH